MKTKHIEPMPDHIRATLEDDSTVTMEPHLLPDFLREHPLIVNTFAQQPLHKRLWTALKGK